MITEAGQEIAWGELHVGSRSIFAAAVFTEVSRPTPRRLVMQIDFVGRNSVQAAIGSGQASARRSTCHTDQGAKLQEAVMNIRTCFAGVMSLLILSTTQAQAQTPEECMSEVRKVQTFIADKFDPDDPEKRSPPPISKWLNLMPAKGMGRNA